jgi:pimeloyl-ACP methyl ester carboxylesterase
MSSIRRAALTLAGIGVLGCDGPELASRLPTAPLRDEVSVAASAADTWVSHVVDTTGYGAIYGLFVPPNWDERGRRLVVYVHGLVDADNPIALPPFPGGQLPVHPGAILDSLGKHGFAVAYSSFSENGYAVQDGAQRSHQLRGLFASHFGQPARTYIYGKSLGGLIGIMLAEEYPEQYAGVFAECGLVGSVSALLRYKFDVRRLFDYFYPGVVPGNAVGAPEDWVPSLSQDTARILGAMRADMRGAFVIAKIDQTPIPFRNSTELLQGIVELVYTHALGVNDIIQRTHGRPPVSSSTFTSSGLDPALLESINRETLHYEATRDAANFLERWYEPSGDLRTPVMTFTSSWDPRLPPILNDSIYYARVKAAGRLDMLRQRVPPEQRQPPGSPDAYGHCTLKQTERLPAFLHFVTVADSIESATR